MAIADVLLEIKKIANENLISEPYIVGGLPRDKVLGRSRLVTDVDITTGDESVRKLALLTATKYQVKPNQMPDGHFDMTIGHVKFDFSSNFHSPDAEFFLTQAGVKNITQMQLELFSRDFTCNTLIVPLNLRRIKDPTGLAIDDINKKLLRTPLPPRITLRDDPKRVVRIIYLACKLGFEVEVDIIEWVKNNPDRIHKAVSGGFSRRKLAEAMRHDPKRALRLMAEMDLWNIIQIPKNMQEEIVKQRAIK